MINLLYFSLGLLLEKEETEAALNNCSFLHEETQLGIGCVGLVHAPVFLDSYGGQFSTPGSFEHAGWDFDELANVILVSDTIK